MSLFGGDSTQPSESSFNSEDERSPPSDTRRSPSTEREHGLQNAQSAQELSSDPEADFTSPLSIESESDEPARPNRFQGPRHTWRKYTAADREITESLGQLQNQDLAAHLYNAHALKRRVRRPSHELASVKTWQNNEHWLKKGDGLQYIDVSGETQMHLVPSKDWTAWPLSPAEVPRHYKKSGQGAFGSGQGDWAIGNADVHDVGEELRDELLATFLGQAKERWRARETTDVPVHEAMRMTQSQSRSRSRSVKSARSYRPIPRPDTDVDEDGSQSDRAETQDEEQEKFGHITGRRRGRVAQPETFDKPMFLADDTKARRILDPTINSILNKVDDLALAIRRTRLNHFGRKDYYDRSSLSEFTSGLESSAHTSRRTSRVRPDSRQSSDRASRAASVQSHRRASITGRRARRKPSDSLVNSDSDMLMDDNDAGVRSKRRSRPGSTADERSPSANRDETRRAGLMDWSEVLGLAAVKGWDEQVIARAAQRCATLFGESMSFMPLNEELATKPVPEPVQYTPSTIPASAITASRPFAVEKRPLFQTGTWRCPHVNCYGHNKDFESPHRVVEHCRRVHGYDPRTNDSDNEDRKVGGVHIDGFLQPIVAQRGWIERGKSRAGSEKKRQKTVRAESADTDVAITIESESEFD